MSRDPKQSLTRLGKSHHVAQDRIQSNVILRPREAWQYLGISRSSLYRYVDTGLLPKPIRLGPQTTGWRLSTLEAFLDERERGES
ncbi:helix-turn-helix transcriptional regulator [Guyparkeria hydrothermalis]|uniref:helix-turn-helix transcriptional regulator n=1 Tax=Guyparkeria hydrothermalis TaxID=923 RepID=UPI003D32EBF2